MNVTPVLTIRAILAVEVLVLGILLYFIPVLTRPSLFFSVTVDPAFRREPEGRRIVFRYRAIVLAGTAVALGMALMGQAQRWEIQSWLAPLVVLAAAITGFFDARRRVLPHALPPDSTREAELAPRRTALPGGFWGQAGPFLILAAAALWLGLHWQSIPARFPVHWRLDGTPDGWAARTPWGVFGVPGVNALVCLLLLGVNWGIVHLSRRVHASGPEAEAEHHFRARVLLLVLLAEYMIAAVTAWLSLTVLAGGSPGRTGTVIVTVSVAAIAVLVFVLMRAGQGGSRLVKTTAGRPAGDRSEDRFWKAGLFYVNPGDPAVFVEKRFGIGYTLNFGHRWVWISLAVIAVIAAVVLGLNALG